METSLSVMKATILKMKRKTVSSSFLNKTLKQTCRLNSLLVKYRQVLELAIRLKFKEFVARNTLVLVNNQGLF